MTTTTRAFTAEDYQQVAQACDRLRENGFDNRTEAGIDCNTKLLLEYFEQNPTVPVTVATIFQAVEARKTDFKWLTPAELEYHKIAEQNPAAATAFQNWFTGQGRPGTLVNTGDQGFQNASTILVELRGREVNQTTIYQAIGRIGHNANRRQLSFVPLPKQVSAAQHQDDGKGFITEGLHKQKDGSLGKSPLDYAREARARSEAEAANPTEVKSTPLSASDQQWKNMAEQLLSFGTHGQQAAIKRVYDENAGAVSWRKTYEACARVAKQFGSANRSIR